MPSGTVAVRDKPKLWTEVQQKWLKGGKGGPAGKWNARKAMLAVNEYKRRGGGYKGPRDPKNSLKKWEREKWGYVDGDKNSRYLPKKVRDQLTPAEKKEGKSRKKGKKGKHVPYSKSVNAKMRKAGIYSKKSAKKASAKMASGKPVKGPTGK